MSVVPDFTGIVGDLAEDGPASAPVPYLYLCATARSWPDPNYVARTSDPRAFAADLRGIVRELDSTRAIFGLRPLQDDGLVELRPDGLQTTSRGRMLLRIIAMCFDRYLPTTAASTPRFSRTV